MGDQGEQITGKSGAGISRRAFLGLAAAVSLDAASPELRAVGSVPGIHGLLKQTQSTGNDAADATISYMDGYHGGIEGHMPPGSWRDILSALREFPEWKISLDIEPRSWEVLRERDPEAFAELSRLLLTRGADNRVEMVGATFAQPYGWALSGESNIRQMQYGVALIQKNFPGLAVRNYVVQEPCWASCLPQILRSLGFTGACLKNASTAWGGYTRGFDAETVQWTGPDGTAIRAVPRYATERLQHVYETESIDATPEFARRCREHGIAHPAGMCLQDLGWTAKPRVEGKEVQFRTWEQYFDLVASDRAPVWRFTTEDILVALPWGDQTLRTVAQQVRSAENAIVAAERLSALLAIHGNQSIPEGSFHKAWEQLLLAQAHDAWITATTRRGREAWAFQVAANTLACQNFAEETAAAAMALLAGGATLSRVDVPLGEQTVLLFNSLGTAREEVVTVALATDPGTRSVQLETADGRTLPVQQIVDRSYRDVDALKGMSRRHDIEAEGEAQGGINHLLLLAKVQVPALGYTAVRVRPSAAPPATATAGGAAATQQPDGTWVVETDLYRVVVDPHRGGTIRSLVCKQEGARELVSDDATSLFAEYKAYLIEEGGWFRSGNAPATVVCEEPGPVRVTLRVESKVGSVRLTTRLQLCAGEPRVDFAVTLHVDHPTWIGDPYTPKPTERLSDPRRSQNDGKWKLQVQFPFAPHGALFKSSAFAVCRSEVKDTSFQRWDEIRHNIITQWVDLLSTDESFGLALMTDHTTGYNFGPEQPLGLVLGWAWDGSFWWGKHPITEDATIHFALLPHRSDWRHAQVPAAYTRFCEPLRSQLASLSTVRSRTAYSLVDVGATGLELSAALMEGDTLLLRFFNAAGAANHRVRLGFVPARVEAVTLAGTVLDVLHPEDKSEAGCSLDLAVPPFGLYTVRCHQHKP